MQVPPSSSVVVVVVSKMSFALFLCGRTQKARHDIFRTTVGGRARGVGGLGGEVGR